MKYARTIGLVILMMAIVTSMSFAAGKPSKSAIVGSAHDLRAGFAQYGYNAYALCNYCHIAHKVAASTYPSNIGPLLWNHTLSSVAAYGVYSSDIFNSYGTDIADLGPLNTGAYVTSNMCLSCHDGTVAIASSYDYADALALNGKEYGSGATGFTYMPSTAVIKDLTNTHPVNFTYYNAAWIPQAGVLAPASPSSVDGAGLVPLEQGKMQCYTCHDAHNGASAIFEQPFPTQASGTFCTYCHL